MESKVSEGGLNVTLTIRLLMHGKVRGSQSGGFLAASFPASVLVEPRSGHPHTPPPQLQAAGSRCLADGEGGMVLLAPVMPATHPVLLGTVCTSSWLHYGVGLDSLQVL